MDDNRERTLISLLESVLRVAESRGTVHPVERSLLDMARTQVQEYRNRDLEQAPVAEFAAGDPYADSGPTGTVMEVEG